MVRGGEALETLKLNRPFLGTPLLSEVIDMVKLYITLESREGRPFIRLVATDRYHFASDTPGVTCLENITPGDIQITPEARDALMNRCEYRPSEKGLEFFGHRRRALKWGSEHCQFWAPLNHVNIHPGAPEWISTLSIGKGSP